MVGYWDWDLENNTEYLSPAFKKMLGYEVHEMENRPESWQKIAHPDDLPLLLDSMRTHIKSSGLYPMSKEIRFYHKEGHLVWIWCRGKVIEWDDEGNPKRLVGSHVNITDRNTC